MWAFSINGKCPALITRPIWDHTPGGPPFLVFFKRNSHMSKKNKIIAIIIFVIVALFMMSFISSYMGFLQSLEQFEYNIQPLIALSTNQTAKEVKLQVIYYSQAYGTPINDVIYIQRMIRKIIPNISDQDFEKVVACICTYATMMNYEKALGNVSHRIDTKSDSDKLLSTSLNSDEMRDITRDIIALYLDNTFDDLYYQMVEFLETLDNETLAYFVIMKKNQVILDSIHIGNHIKKED